MSAKAGTIQGSQTGVSWAGARVAAIMLTVILALTLFAMTRGSGTADTTPRGTRFEITQQLSGGRNVAPAATDTVPASQPIMIGSYACHQCR